MNSTDLQTARARLGELWGFGRAITAAELGRALRFSGRDPGVMIRRYELAGAKVPPLVAVAVLMLLGGALPPDGLDAVRLRRGAKR